MNQSFNVREFKIAQIGDVLEIQEECGLSFWSAEGYRSALTNPHTIGLVILKGEFTAGFLIASLIISEKLVELYNLGIRSEYRREKAASFLLKELLHRCKVQQMEKITLEVRKSNAGAIAFYEKFGFEVKGTRKNFFVRPPEDALLMEVSLGSSE